MYAKSSTPPIQVRDDQVDCPECGKGISVLHIRQHIDYAHSAMREDKSDEGRQGRRVQLQGKVRRVRQWWEHGLR
jgi:hypothetical protein